MTYYADTRKELARAGAQEGDLALYTGTVERFDCGGHSGCASRGVYAYCWRDGDAHELAGDFRTDRCGQDVLNVNAEGGRYIFLRDRDSGYLRQVFGPAKPFIVSNIGAIPQRVDSFLGHFIVHSGSICRLDENAPRREDKAVLLTLASRQTGFGCGKLPLEAAEIYENGAWRPLNICREKAGGSEFDSDENFTVRDGRAVIQYIEMKSGMVYLDDPLDACYKIFLKVNDEDPMLLSYTGTVMKNGRMEHVRRGVGFHPRKDTVYNFQQIRHVPVMALANDCVVREPDPAFWCLEPDLYLRPASGQERTAPAASPETETGFPA